jgi:hypothetical protein
MPAAALVAELRSEMEQALLSGAATVGKLT